jgi:hypothetical protein
MKWVLRFLRLSWADQVLLSGGGVSFDGDLTRPSLSSISDGRKLLVRATQARSIAQ